MSELTRCNRCSLDEMERRATKHGATVLLTLDDDGWLAARYSDQDEPSAWFRELTDGCVC
jgi:hypothetical protein